MGRGRHHLHRRRLAAKPGQPASLLCDHERSGGGLRKSRHQPVPGQLPPKRPLRADDNLLTEADIDQVIKGTLRVFIRLGLLDPATNNPYAAIGADSEPKPWNTPEHKAVARLVTQKSIVLLKNSENLLPLDKTKIKSIAVIGPFADEILLDWYSGTPPYTVTPLQGIRDKVGPGVIVNFATNNADGEAVKLAKAADVVIVCVGNHPTGGLTNWGKVALPSYGKEAVDRKSIKLEDEKLIKQIYRAKFQHHRRASFPVFHTPSTGPKNTFRPSST